MPNVQYCKPFTHMPTRTLSLLLCSLVVGGCRATFGSLRTSKTPRATAPRAHLLATAPRAHAPRLLGRRLGDGTWSTAAAHGRLRGGDAHRGAYAHAHGSLRPADR